MSERPLEERRPPPPEVGNLRAATHGAFSGLVLPEADALVDLLYEQVEHLHENDFLAVRDYAVAQVRTWRLAAWLERHGEFDARGRLRPAVESLRRWLERAEKARARLGLDPISRATLNVEHSAVLDRVRRWTNEDLAEGRRLREQAEQRRELKRGGPA